MKAYGIWLTYRNGERWAKDVVGIGEAYGSSLLFFEKDEGGDAQDIADAWLKQEGVISVEIREVSINET